MSSSSLMSLETGRLNIKVAGIKYCFNWEMQLFKTEWTTVWGSHMLGLCMIATPEYVKHKDFRLKKRFSLKDSIEPIAFAV